MESEYETTGGTQLEMQSDNVSQVNFCITQSHYRHKTIRFHFLHGMSLCVCVVFLIDSSARWVNQATIRCYNKFHWVVDWVVRIRFRQVWVVSIFYIVFFFCLAFKINVIKKRQFKKCFYSLVSCKCWFSRAFLFIWLCRLGVIGVTQPILFIVWMNATILLHAKWMPINCTCELFHVVFFCLACDGFCWVSRCYHAGVQAIRIRLLFLSLRFWGWLS